MALGSLNKKSAKLLVSSVLPTPVGPKNKKDARGRSGSWSPARERLIAFDTEAIASF